MVLEYLRNIIGPGGPGLDSAGVNVLGGSSMSGQIQYSGLGVVTALIGAGLLFLGYRRGKTRPGDDRTKLDR